MKAPAARLVLAMFAVVFACVAAAAGQQPAASPAAPALAAGTPAPAPAAGPEDLGGRLTAISDSLAAIQKRLDTPPPEPSLFERFFAFLGRLAEALVSQLVWVFIAGDASPGGIFAVVTTLASVLVAAVRIIAAMSGSRMSPVWKARLTTFLLAYALIGAPAILIMGMRQTAPPLQEIRSASSALAQIVARIERLPALQPAAAAVDLAPLQQRLDAIETSMNTLRDEQPSTFLERTLLFLLLCGIIVVGVIAARKSA
jgi:hypothetical protein